MRNMIKKIRKILIRVAIGFIAFVIVFACIANSIRLLGDMFAVVLYGIMIFGFIGAMIFMYCIIMRDLKDVK